MFEGKLSPTGITEDLREGALSLGNPPKATGLFEPFPKKHQSDEQQLQITPLSLRARTALR